MSSVILRPRKIEAMHLKFGCKENEKCKDCCHFDRYHYRTQSFSKCDVYGITSSTASDWNGRNVACGMFNKEYNGIEIIELVKRGTFNVDMVSENQERLF